MSKRLGDDSGRAARAVRQRLESLQRAGLTHLPKAKGAALVAAAANAASPVDVRKMPEKQGVTRASATDAVPSKPARKPAVPSNTSLFDSAAPATIVPPEQRGAALEIIRQEVAACVRCSALASTRTQTVFGVGNPTAKICFFGEAPGADEDRQGEPFVGRAGQLLTKMIQACGMQREDVYILNVLKCRPPENRNPLPDEVTNCRGYFERQLDIIRPEIICCLGAVASQALLQTETTIGKLRKKFHDYRGISVVCTYHPAYLLRNPAAKSDTWEDLKMMMRKLGVEL
jgi:DNA polymerase